MKIYAFLGLALPIAIMALSGGIAYLIPGCTVDEGAGASAACGVIGPFLAAGILGGFVWLVLGVIGLMPALIIWAWVNRNSNENTESNFLLRGFEAEIKEEAKKTNESEK